MDLPMGTYINANLDREARSGRWSTLITGLLVVLVVNFHWNS
jgi:hypothetical protein